MVAFINKLEKLYFSLLKVYNYYNYYKYYNYYNLILFKLKNHNKLFKLKNNNKRFFVIILKVY